MHKFRLATLIALGIATAACGTQNRGLESVHQPVVTRTDYAFDVPTSGAGLSAEEANRVSGWFESLKLGYGDKVSIDLSGGYGSRAARDTVASIAARYGLLLEDNAPLTSGEVAPGSVRVVVSRMKAAVPGCSDWGRASAHNFDNHSLSNYGCAVNGNLAAMIANPEDLVRGQPGTASVDAATAGKAIKTYRDKPSTGAAALTQESAGGK